MPSKYRSTLEKRLGEGVLKGLDYEPFTLPYTQTRSYLPDFVHTEKRIIIEAKGYFRTNDEFRKYRDVALCNPDWEIVFVFSDPNKPIIWAKKRSADGKRMTHAELVGKYGFRSFSAGDIAGIL